VPEPANVKSCCYVLDLGANHVLAPVLRVSNERLDQPARRVDNHNSSAICRTSRRGASHFSANFCLFAAMNLALALRHAPGKRRR